MTDWSEVLAALSDWPDLPLRGTIRELGAPAKPDRALFTGEGPPSVVRPGNGCRIWRDGGRLRIEHPDGRPIFITDGARAWQFTADDGQRPRTDALDSVRFLDLNQYLVRRRTPAEWAGEDLTHPLGAVADTEVAGRVAGRLSSLRRQTKQGFCGSGSTSNPATYFVSAPSPQIRSRNTSTSLSASSSTTSCSPGMDRYSPPRNTNRYSANDVTSANRSSWSGLPKPSHRHRLPLGHRWSSVPPGCHSSTPKPGHSTHPDIGRCWHAARADRKLAPTVGHGPLCLVDTSVGLGHGSLRRRTRRRGDQSTPTAATRRGHRRPTASD